LEGSIHALARALERSWTIAQRGLATDIYNTLKDRTSVEDEMFCAPLAIVRGRLDPGDLRRAARACFLATTRNIAHTALWPGVWHSQSTASRHLPV